MSTPLAGAIAGLFAGLTKAGGETVTYSRGVASINDLVAVPTRERNEDGGGVVSVSPRDRDWIFSVADLVYQSVAWLPEPGDLIDWTDAAGNVHRFEVMTREPNDRPYRFTDQTRQLIRVYSVEIAAPESDE